MLELIIAKNEKARLQKTLSSIVRSASPSVGVQTVGFPGGNDDLELFTKGDGHLWYGERTLTLKDAKIPRYWNALGIYDESRSAQTPTVELNIAVDDNSGRVSGFFARDPATKKIYLMHTGKVGGGAKGVGKTAFLAWSRSTVVPVVDVSGGTQRSGIVIGSLDRETFVGRVERFVKRVALFKEFVKQGHHEDPKFRELVEELQNFSPEFAGLKTGYLDSTVEYLSYHGDVIDELYRKRSKLKTPSEVIYNTNLIDLAVRDSGVLTEVYEAKTSVDRQVLYTAIGQLIVHSAEQPKPRKFLVIPKDRVLPNDIHAAMKEHDIELLRFAVMTDGSGVKVDV
ncbi:hypothetical protein [Bradyrhizobium sp. CCBAU 51627]|uniref:hypothetical protein n=1 Tax=Bradyrhizobium sp. CCBAU 51627 TaxID=1325088 RepID=UPI002305C552|nr:hypothetical protein [Bradyrhizobium sp. CCBAU 51627]MDA9435236.1 hypothetical protein [Bradyrhizobium sp. CCBAU 51627]